MKKIKNWLCSVFFSAFFSKSPFELGIVYTFGILTVVLYGYNAPFLSSMEENAFCSTVVELNVFGDIISNIDNAFSYVEKKISGRKLSPTERFLYYTGIFLVLYLLTTPYIKGNPGGDGGGEAFIFPAEKIEEFIQAIFYENPEITGKPPMEIFSLLLKTYINNGHCETSFLTDIGEFYGYGLQADPIRCSRFGYGHLYIAYLVHEQPDYFIALYNRTMLNQTSTSKNTLHIIRMFYYYAYERSL